jgi:hypothetical protein
MSLDCDQYFCVGRTETHIADAIPQARALFVEHHALLCRRGLTSELQACVDCATPSGPNSRASDGPTRGHVRLAPHRSVAHAGGSDRILAATQSNARVAAAKRRLGLFPRHGKDYAVLDRNAMPIVANRLSVPGRAASKAIFGISGAFPSPRRIRSSAGARCSRDDFPTRCACDRRAWPSRRITMIACAR